MSDKKTLGDFLKEEGRTQIWLQKKLAERGLKRDIITIHKWCTRYHQPQKKAFIIDHIAAVMEVMPEVIAVLFPLEFPNPLQIEEEHGYE